MKLTSARALSSQLALVSLILSLQPAFGQMSKVAGTIVSSVAMSLLIYSLNIPRMTLRGLGQPKHGLVVSIASGWMYLVGVLVVQGTMAYAGRETILEPDTTANYTFFAAFFIFMILVAIALGISEKKWKLTQEDVGGGPVSAYAGMLGMAGIFGTVSIIAIGIFARKTSGKIKERFLTIWPLRRKRRKGLRGTIEKAAPTTAFLFLLMLFGMPNVSAFANDLFECQVSQIDILTICLIVSSFLGTLVSMYYDKFQLSWRLLASLPFILSLCLAVVEGSMLIYPVYRNFFEGMTRSLDNESALFLDSIVSSLLLLYILLMFSALYDWKFFPNSASIYPLFLLTALTASFILNIQKTPPSTLRMLLILSIAFFSFSIVTLIGHFLKRVFRRLHPFRSKHAIAGWITLVLTCVTITISVAVVWIFSIIITKGNLDAIRNIMDPAHAVLTVSSIVFPFVLLDSSELVKDV